MKQTILVTGGAGYIGSHATTELLNSGYDVVVLDNLSTGFLKAVDKRATLIVGDVRDIGLLNSIFSKYKIIGVMHFAAKISVGESVSNPITYYDNNFTTVLALIRAIRTYNIKNIVFSSTAAVYGNGGDKVLTEDMPLLPLSPYGKSKLMAETLIRDSSKAYDFNYCIFRYFNVAGASKDSSIGEAHPNETHLIPNIINAALFGKKLTIFGNDYNTRDGTNLRDYVHVVDLVKAHVLGMKMLIEKKRSDIFNLGSKTGYTNLEIVKAVEEVLNKKIDYTIGPRRPGDSDSIVASNDHALEILHWKPENDLKKMIQDDINFRTKHQNLYGKNHFSTDQNELKIVDKKISSKSSNNNMYENIELDDAAALREFQK